MKIQCSEILLWIRSLIILFPSIWLKIRSSCPVLVFHILVFTSNEQVIKVKSYYKDLCNIIPFCNNDLNLFIQQRLYEQIQILTIERQVRAVYEDKNAQYIVVIYFFLLLCLIILSFLSLFLRGCEVLKGKVIPY